MKRQPLLAAALVGALLLGFVAPSFGDSRDDLNRQKRDVNGQLGDARQSYDESSKEYAEAAASLRKAQGRLGDARTTLGQTRGELATARARDAEMQARLDRAEARLRTATAKLRAGKAKLKSSEGDVREYTLETLREGDRGMRAFGELVKGESPTLFSERASLNGSVGDAQLATMQRLEAAKVILNINRDEVQGLRDEVARARAEAAANLQVKADLEAQAAEQTRKVSALVDDQSVAARKAKKIQSGDASKVQALESDRNRLNARLAELARQRAAAIARARERERQQANQNSGGGGGGSSSSGGGGSSSGGGGGGGGSTLSYPANGPITSPYGMRRHPITGVYKLHDGTDFGIPCGTPVRAAASGRILEQYFNAGYGNRIILDNGILRGVSVTTTYNHLSRFVLSPGTRVSRGQLIGYSGTTGYSTGCHLHFMVLVNGATVNPMGWL